MENLKEDFIEKIIPSLIKMIEREQEHLEFLKKFKQKINWFTSFFTDVERIEDMIMISTDRLNHYKLRLNEYIEYSNKL